MTTPAEHDVYVSPSGNDTWSGGLPEPNVARTDGPLQSLAAAQAAVRALKADLSEPRVLRVCLRGGLYELPAAWRFSAEDSGFGRRQGIWPQRAQTWPITWCAYEGETPFVSGGRRLDNAWQLTEQHGRVAWVRELTDVAPFSQLWVNGERRERPRLPKDGLRQVAKAVDPDFTIHGHNDSAWGFGFHEGELRADWRNLQDVELHFYGWWVDRTVKLKEVNEATRLATFDRDVKMRLEWSPGDGVDYVVENVFEALTDPGEWYHDRAAGKLYYLPLPGEDPATAEVIIPRLDQLLHLEGATHLRFEGLRFAYSEWTLPDDLSGMQQAAIHVPGALQVRQGDDVVFHDCHIEHVCSYGADILDDSIETVFSHCTFRDLGAGGVRIWHGCRRNALLDCEIGDGGHRFTCAVGVLIGKASGNRVVHCHIHDFYYTGISVGWNWGYAESDGYGNIIEWNHIHDIGKGLLSDMGGIYLLGHAPGTRLRYNHIHDIECRRYGGWCMYTDEGSTDVLIESNLCYRANRTAFNQHYGRNNLVRRNILAYGGDAVISYGAPEAHLGLIVEENILLSHDQPIIRGVAPDRWTPAQTVFRRNLYWCETGPVRFDHGGLELYGSQPFPNGYLQEAPRFATLDGAVDLTTFYARNGTAVQLSDNVALRLEHQGDTWVVHGRFQRPERFETTHGPVWNREHLELFLQAEDGPIVQLGLAADGETAIDWHQGEAPPDFAWEAEADDQGSQWLATMRLTLPGSSARFLLGFALAAEIGDMTSWQARGQDPQGLVADPLFVDAPGGDFRLRPDSPALALGFVPFEANLAGPRSPS